MTAEQILLAKIKESQRVSTKVETVSISSIPTDKPFVIWGKKELEAASRNVEVVFRSLPRVRKDGTGMFYELRLKDGTVVNSNDPCDSNVARIVEIPSEVSINGVMHKVYTLKWDNDSKSYSSNELNYCDVNRVNCVGPGVFSYEMELQAKINMKIIRVAAVADK